MQTTIGLEEGILIGDISTLVDLEMSEGWKMKAKWNDFDTQDAFLADISDENCIFKQCIKLA